jgi:hypothetical protein
MINARLALITLSPFLLLGATCVTSVEQRGPAGPWVGEVVNTSPDTAQYVTVWAEILDPTGNSVTSVSVLACPPTLLPGERGTFEILFPIDMPSETQRRMALPLQARVQVISDSVPELHFSREGLSVRVLEKDEERRLVLAEVRNDSPNTYYGVLICANLRTPTGKLAEVGKASLFPSVLRPGEARAVSIAFNSLPPGVLEFYTDGGIYGDGEVILDPALFHVTATRVIDGPGDRRIQVVGEVNNSTGRDLSRMKLQAYIAGSPAVRVEAEVGCGGAVALGSTAPVAFTLPLETADHPSVVIAGIQGEEHYLGLLSIPIRDVSKQPVRGSQSVRVAATLVNQTDSWIEIDGICLNLRDRTGKLVGTLSPQQGGILGPGATMTVSGEVADLGGAASAEAIAYGHPVERGPIVPPAVTGP